MRTSLKVDFDFLRTLLHYIKSTYLPPKRHNPKFPDQFTSGDLHFFAPAVAELSAAFTSERSSRAANYFNTKEARSSYLLYFLIPNMLKVQWVLEQQRFAELFAGEAEVRVADIGCGPCTGILAATQYWNRVAPQQKLQCVAVDQSAAMLKDGAALFNRLFPSPESIHLTTHTASLAHLRKALGVNRFHILIVSNVLNELGGGEERYNFICSLMAQHLTPNGRVIIIEPALQRSTRDLMLLRDQLVSPSPSGEGRGEGVAPVATVLAPCLHQALCPMRAANPRDWCHSYLEWERPQVIADLDMLIGNKKDYLKMAYMVMAPPSHGERAGVRGRSLGLPPLPNPPPKGEGIWRVVSAPMKSKGKLEILLCGENGKLLRVTRLDKDRSQKNAALESLQRGDIVEYAGNAKCDRETLIGRPSI